MERAEVMKFSRGNISDSIIGSYFSLAVHGVEGAFYGKGEKTVIPSKVIGKFSIRIVPDMKPEKVCVIYDEKEDLHYPGQLFGHLIPQRRLEEARIA